MHLRCLVSAAKPATLDLHYHPLLERPAVPPQGVGKLRVEIVFKFAMGWYGRIILSHHAAHEMIKTTMVMTVEANILVTPCVATRNPQCTAIGFGSRTGKTHQLGRFDVF